MSRTTAEWREILLKCGVSSATAAHWAPTFAEVIGSGTFSMGDEELDDFLGQILHESHYLEKMSENLYYGAERLCVVWPRRFPSLDAARPYARSPEALANKVYGGRMGNTELGDGWKYRGRSPLQITGKDNYARVGKLMGQDLVTSPELLEQPRYALEACIHWWEDRIPDEMIGDTERVSTRVNGGQLGMAERIALTNKAGDALA
jgi:putative chitinase